MRKTECTAKDYRWKKKQSEASLCILHMNKAEIL